MGGTFLEGILALKRDDDLFEEYIFFLNFLIRCREFVFGYLTLGVGFHKSSFDE